MTTSIGFHTDVGGNPTGIGEYVRELDANGIPCTIVCANGTTGLSDVTALWDAGSTVPHNVFWRRVIGSANADGSAPEHYSVPNYHHPPQQAAQEHWNMLFEEGFPQQVHQYKDKIWLLPINEVDKNRADWIGYFSVEFAKIANSRGYKVAMPAWSPGEPEPEHWHMPGMLAYLRYCERESDMAAVALHEYSLDVNDIRHGDGNLIGRFQYLIEACNLHTIAVPRIHITECGWTLNDAPSVGPAIQDIDYLFRIYSQQKETESVALWYLGPRFGGIADKVQPLIEPTTTYMKENYESSQVDNLLINPNFNDGWTDITTFGRPQQQPNGWGLWMTFVGEENISGGVTTGIPECTHKDAEQIPDWHELGLVPPYTYKIQAVNMAFGGGLDQTITGLEPGKEYKYTCKLLFLFHPPDSRDRVPPLDERDIVIAIYCGDNNYSTIGQPLPSHRQWVTYEVTGIADEDGKLEVGFEVGTYWQNSRDIFVDGHSVTAVSAPPPPEEKHKVVILKIPQEVEVDEWEQLGRWAHDNYKRTMTASHDDMLTMLAAGNDESYAVIYEPDYPSQEQAIQVLEENGYNWQSLTFNPPDHPLDGVEFGHLFNVPYVLTSLFNAPRSYGSHEGTDYDILTNISDSKESVLCILAGTVTGTLEREGGYGKRVYIKSLLGSGAELTITYAHLDDWYVVVGQWVQKGRAIGEIGSTGNSSGEHIHVTFQLPGWGLDGYVVPDVIDPTPYIPILTEVPGEGDYVGPPVDFTPIIHGPPDDWRWPTVEGMYQSLNMPVKFLSNGVNVEYTPNYDVPLVRVFVKMGDIDKRPNDVWHEVKDDLIRFYGNGITDFEVFNEPNLVSEGLGINWSNGYEFGEYLKSFIILARSEMPNARFWFPGMSPGVPWTNQFAFTNQAWPIVKDMCYGFCMHAYTGVTDNEATAVDEIVTQIIELQEYLRLWNHPLLVSEASVNRQPANNADQYRANVYRTVEQRLSSVAGLAGIVWFTGDWHSPPPEQAAHGESWYGTGLPELYKNS